MITAAEAAFRDSDLMFGKKFGTLYTTDIQRSKDHKPPAIVFVLTLELLILTIKEVCF